MLELLVRWDAYANRKYYEACGTWRRRFWFEVTGQGQAARSYERSIYCQRWWETKRHARRRVSRGARSV
jgi:hypothetical protein